MRPQAFLYDFSAVFYVTFPLSMYFFSFFRCRRPHSNAKTKCQVIIYWNERIISLSGTASLSFYNFTTIRRRNVSQIEWNEPRLPSHDPFRRSVSHKSRFILAECMQFFTIKQLWILAGRWKIPPLQLQTHMLLTNKRWAVVIRACANDLNSEMRCK